MPHGHTPHISHEDVSGTGRLYVYQGIHCEQLHLADSGVVENLDLGSPHLLENNFESLWTPCRERAEIAAERRLVF